MVDKLLNNKNLLEDQITKSQKVINNFKKNKSAEIASRVLINHL